MERGEVVSLVKSCVVTRKGGMPLTELNREYREFEGTNIPFRSFGHSSLEDFLRSIPEIYSTGINAEGVLLFNVKDEKFQHIQDLVSRQKSPKKKPKRRFQTYGSKFSSGSYKNSYTKSAETKFQNRGYSISNSTFTVPNGRHTNGNYQSSRNYEHKPLASSSLNTQNYSAQNCYSRTKKIDTLDLSKNVNSYPVTDCAVRKQTSSQRNENFSFNNNKGLRSGNDDKLKNVGHKIEIIDHFKLEADILNNMKQLQVDASDKPNAAQVESVVVTQPANLESKSARLLLPTKYSENQSWLEKYITDTNCQVVQSSYISLPKSQSSSYKTCNPIIQTTEIAKLASNKFLQSLDPRNNDFDVHYKNNFDMQEVITSVPKKTNHASVILRLPSLHVGHDTLHINNAAPNITDQNPNYDFVPPPPGFFLASKPASVVNDSSKIRRNVFVNQKEAPQDVSPPSIRDTLSSVYAKKVCSPPTGFLPNKHASVFEDESRDNKELISWNKEHMTVPLGVDLIRKCPPPPGFYMPMQSSLIDKENGNTQPTTWFMQTNAPLNIDWTKKKHKSVENKENCVAAEASTCLYDLDHDAKDIVIGVIQSMTNDTIECATTQSLFSNDNKGLMLDSNYMFNFQMIGDDFLAHLHGPDSNYKKTRKELCKSGLSIRDCLANITECAVHSHVLVLVGCVDILQGVPFEITEIVMTKLIKELEHKVKRAIYLTVPPLIVLKSSSSETVKKGQELFNKWLLKQQDELGITVFDSFSVFSSPQGVKQNLFERTFHHPEGVDECFALWNKDGAQLLMEKLAEYC